MPNTPRLCRTFKKPSYTCNNCDFTCTVSIDKYYPIKDSTVYSSRTSSYFRRADFLPGCGVKALVLIDLVLKDMEEIKPITDFKTIYEHEK